MAINNSIEKIKNYVGDPSNLYAVFRASALTTDLETPMIQFVGAKTMSYPVFPKSTTDMEDYDPTTGYSRVSATLVRKEATVSQDKGYQNAIDELDLQDSGTTAISYINNNVRQKDVPTVDKYRLNVLGGSGHYVNDGVATSDNALALYDKAAAYLVDNEYPLEGTILYCTTAFYGAMKDSSRIYRTLGADGGNVIDATTLVPLCQTTHGRIVCLPTFYYDPTLAGHRPLATVDQVEIAEEWLYNKVCIKYGVHPSVMMINVDSAASDLFLEFNRRGHFECSKVDKKDIMADMRRMQSVLSYEGLFAILDDGYRDPITNELIGEHDMLIEELQAKVINEKNGKPEDGNDHCIDACKYGTRKLQLLGVI